MLHFLFLTCVSQAALEKSVPGEGTGKVFPEWLPQSANGMKLKAKVELIPLCVNENQQSGTHFVY